MQSIVPFLLFSGQAEEAVNFYMTVFKNASIHEMIRYGEGAPMPSGTVVTVSFQINGQEFVALNGPDVKFSEAISFQVLCDDQAEVDDLWEKLTEGGSPNVCGWLTDRFGMSWQITPRILMKRISDEDPVKAGRVMREMMKMTKIDISAIERAYAETP